MICRTKYSLGIRLVRPWAWLYDARLDGGGSGLWPWDYLKSGKERKVGGLT